MNSNVMLSPSTDDGLVTIAHGARMTWSQPALKCSPQMNGLPGVIKQDPDIINEANEAIGDFVLKVRSGRTEVSCF